MSQSAVQIPDDVQIEYDREAVRRYGLRAFAKLAWHIVEPADALQWNWHLDAISDHVQAVIQRELQELAACIPPGMTKSKMISVLGSGYAWAIRPSYRVLSVAYADRLTRRDSRFVRKLILSQWFQDRWPLALEKQDESRLENAKSGFRLAGSVRSGIIGDRGNLLLIDDPLSIDTVESPAERARTSRFVWETLPSRMTNFDEDGKILIMQRLHGADTAAEARDRGWEMLVLPNEYEPASRCITSLGFKDPRTKEGELLHPARMSAKASAKMKSFEGIGPRAYAGQYQQRPAPREGNIVKMAWFANRFKKPSPNPVRIIISADCASKPEEKNDPSAFLTIAEYKDHYEFWHYHCQRYEFPDLVRAAIDQYNRGDWTVNAMLIEDKDAGQQLIQQLKRDTKIPVIAINPGSLDKGTRLETQTPVMEAGNVWLPEDAPWVADFLEELTTIPGAPHDESGDCVSQALKWLAEKKRIPLVGPGSVGGKESARL